MNQAILRALLSMLAVVSFLAAPARAFVPAESVAAAYEIRPAGDLPAPYGRFVRSEERLDADLERFTARLGGVWAVQRDPVLGTPHHLLGSGIEYVHERIDTEARASEVAASFLAENGDLLKVDADRLGAGVATEHAGKWAVIFPETYAGLMVFGGRAHVVMTEGGRVYAIGADFHPNIALDPHPSVSEAEAVAIAGAGLGFVDGRDEFTGAELLVYPETRGGTIVYRLAWSVTQEVQDPLGLWRTWVDAGTGQVFGRENLYEFADVTGTARAIVNNPNYCIGESELAMMGLDMNVLGVGSAVSDTTGDFVVAGAGTDSVELWSQFYGPSFNVDYYTGTDSRDTVKVLPGQPYTWLWDDSNSDKAERDAWYHSNVVRNWIKALDPSFTGLDYRMRVRVNRVDGYCPGNAWWDGQGMNFCLEGNSYGNTASIGDVVYHEYGHGVTGRVYSGFGFDGAVSEGNSDVIAMLSTGNSIVGPGFTINMCFIGIRSSNTSMMYPDDLSGEGHHDGQLICGYFWELRGRMITTYGVEQGTALTADLWHFSRKLGKPYDMPDQVTWTFIYDDDDGNLDTGTPNFADMAASATARGFAVPVISQGVQITHAGLESTTDEVSSRTVTAVVTGLSAGIDPSSVMLHHRVDGGLFTDVGMTPTGGADEYEATIPAAAQGSRVEYFVDASDSASHHAASPGNAPVALHKYDVVYLYDPCETVGGWTIGDVTDDATAGIWIDAEPIGNETRPDFDATPAAGENCFVTGNTANVRNGKTTLYSPVYDLAGKSDVLVRYDRWYSNDFEAVAPLNGRDDYWNVDVTGDGSQTWLPVEETNNGTESWIEIEVDVSALFPVLGDIQFRFTAADTGSATRIHAAVDELRILVGSDISTDVADADGAANAPRRFALDQNRPNPFNPVTSIAYEVGLRGKVTLGVYDVRGRHVRTLVDGVQTEGAYRVTWDGKDDGERPVGSGVYFYRLRNAEGEITKKMTLLR